MTIWDQMEMQLAYTAPIINPRIQTELEALALLENSLNRSDYVYSELHDFPAKYSKYRGTGNALTYLAFYPSLQLTRSEFNCASLAKRTGFDITLIEPRDIRSIIICNTLQLMSRPQYLTFINIVHGDVSCLLLAEKTQILELIDLHASHVSDSNATTNGIVSSQLSCQEVRGKCEQSFEALIELLAGWYDDDHSAPVYQAVNFDEMILDTLAMPNAVFRHPYFDAWIDKLDEIYVRTAATIFWSNFDATKLISGRWWQKNPKKSQLEHAEKIRVVQMLAHQFGEHLNIVPDPRTIREAIDMAHTPQLERLRELIDLWLEASPQSSDKIVSRIQNDISKATTSNSSEI